MEKSNELNWVERCSIYCGMATLKPTEKNGLSDGRTTRSVGMAGNELFSGDENYSTSNFPGYGPARFGEPVKLRISSPASTCPFPETPSRQHGNSVKSIWEPGTVWLCRTSGSSIRSFGENAVNISRFFVRLKVKALQTFRSGPYASLHAWQHKALVICSLLLTPV